MRYFFLIFFLTCVSVVGICGFRGSHTRRPSIELFPDMVRQNRYARDAKRLLSRWNVITAGARRDRCP